MPQTVLLLTAAIETNPDMGNNLRSDPTLRRGDYLDALKHYIRELPPEVRDVVFIDNTAADLSDFSNLRVMAEGRGRKLHLIGFKGSTPVALGKGVCEFEILDTAHRWLSERFEPETIVWKVTGRLQLKNIGALFRSRPETAEIYIDMRSVPFIGETLGGNDWAEMRVMCYTIKAYGEHLAGRGESFGYVTEKGLFAHLEGVLQNQEVSFTPRFAVQPRFRGICGGSNKSYESLEYVAKDHLRSLTRSLLPSLWL